MTKTEIKAALKDKLGLNSSDCRLNFRPSKDKGYFGEVAIGSSSPMDITSVGSDCRASARININNVIRDLGLTDSIILSEVDRWTYAGVKGCENYDRGYRTYFVRMAWKEVQK